MDWAWLLAADPEARAGPSRQRLLYQRLREAVLTGRWASGTRLPASRELAHTLGVARNTVLFAYEQLAAEGYVVATRHGTRVAALPPGPAQGATVAQEDATPGLSQRALAALPLPADAEDERALRPFALGVPDVARFPIRQWRACLDRAWRGASARQLSYAPPGGEPVLRTALAAYLSSVRGFPVAPAQVVITAGTQSGLDVCARLLADAGDTAWVEDPGYPAARTAFELAGLRLHGVPVDEAGLAPRPADWQHHPPRLVFVTPSHQFPTGAVLPLARRLALLEQAQATGAWILEDDYDSEFHRATAAPLPALYGLRPGAPVVYVGTFSKTLVPALRLGYLVLPAALAQRFAHSAGQLTRPGQSIEQLALADFLQRGHYTTHLRHMRRSYAARRDGLQQALQQHFGAAVQVSGGAAGLHLVLRWVGDPPDVAVASAARALGLLVQPLRRYALAPLGDRQGLVLGYGSVPEAQLGPAVARLALAWRGVAL
jgi:GntR family transcriptional regulator / MocR family aminotransferase